MLPLFPVFFRTDCSFKLVVSRGRRRSFAPVILPVTVLYLSLSPVLSSLPFSTCSICLHHPALRSNGGKFIWLTYIHLGIAWVLTHWALKVGLADCGLELRKPLLPTAGSRHSTVAADQCCLAFCWPQEQQAAERNYYQLWPLRVAVPLVIMSSIFGILGITDKFALYRSTYYKITLAGSTAS